MHATDASVMLHLGNTVSTTEKVKWAFSYMYVQPATSDVLLNGESNGLHLNSIGHSLV